MVVLYGWSPRNLASLQDGLSYLGCLRADGKITDRFRKWMRLEEMKFFSSGNWQSNPALRSPMPVWLWECGVIGSLCKRFGIQYYDDGTGFSKW